MKTNFRRVAASSNCGPLIGANLISGLLIATLLVVLPQMAWAQTTYTVCSSGCNYASPEAAVNDPAVISGDTINISTGTYILGATLQVNKSITILANNSVFDANGIRAINVFGGANLSLTNVTIRNGRAGAGFGGGALWVSGGSVATVINGTFENNQADFGGAVHNIGSTVTLRESVFTGNRATVGDGGAVLTDSGGTTYVVRTAIDGNQASVAGGGLAVADTDSGLHLIASTVSNNALTGIGVSGASNDVTTGSSYGCPVAVSGISAQSFVPTLNSLSAYDFEIRFGGSPPGAGTVFVGRIMDIQNGLPGVEIGTSKAIIPVGAAGSIWLRYTMDIPVVLKPDNLYLLEAGVPESAGFSILGSSGNPYAVGQASNCGSSLLTDVDFNFRTFGGAPGDGGGIHASSAGHAGLFNTTVSGNVGDGATAGPDSNAIVSTLFSTITNNSGNGLTAKNGDTDGLVFITASIVAGNGASDCDGVMTTSGYNLIGDDSNCTVTAFTGDLIGTTGAPIDPLLGPLQNNGGWTSTHAIDLNSPAFDAAGPIALGLPCFDATDDQRGAARPDGLFCDIGAYEVVVPVSAGNLQLLIDAATANGETLITVPDGIYDELITLGNGQILQGSGPDKVVIDATGLGGSAITASGDFTLQGIRVTGGGSTGSGGAISARMAGTDITLSNVVFDNNDASFDGGAIFLANGTLDGTNVTFDNNNAGRDGGAIAGGASVSISASLFEGNTAADRGGAVFNDGNLSITDTTINSSVAGLGGGVFNNDVADVLEVNGSTFSNNTANTAGVTAGGAIGGAGTTDIQNSTFSGNSATAGNGGGIGLTAGSANLNNVTLAFNAASAGGPFYAGPDASISLSNSLLSNNTGGATNCNTVVSVGYNLYDIAPCPAAASDITAEPLINILASNGGLTQTHSLGSTSPALDAADPGQLAIETASALSSSQLSFNGFASESGGDLVPVSGGWHAGSIFASAPGGGSFDLTGSFSTQFSFQITDLVACCGEPSGDGFTFAIAANPTVVGEYGGRLGVATTPGPLGTVSVEFDTWNNGGDVSGNSIGINVGGYVNIDYVVSAAQTAIPGAFDDGNVWTAWIEYHADTNRLDVRVAANGIRPDLPQLTHVVDIAAEVGATGYYGFTGGTAQASATFTVTDWEFFITNCPSFDQRGEPRPQGVACDIGAYESAAIPLAMGDVFLNAVTDQGSNTSYPGVVEVPIIDIPIEKLTGDTFNSPSSAPLGSFPLGSFPIGSFDLRNSPMGSFPLGSFPLGSFPLGSFPIGSFPLSSIPLQNAGGWTEILIGTELADAPLQTVTLEQVMTLDPLPSSVATIALRDLSIEGSPLGSFSLPGLSLGDTTVAELDQWALNAGESDTVCATLAAEDSTFAGCDSTDTLLGLEAEGAPVSALSLSSLPLGSFPIGSFPIGSFPIGSFPLGSFPLGSFPLGSFPIGSFPMGSFPLGSFPLGSFPMGSFNLLAAPLGSFPLGSFPIGSFPLGSFEIDGKSFCEFYDEQAVADGDMTCTQLSVSPGTDTLADLVEALQREAAAVGDTTGGIGSTPLGSFPMGSFPIGSFPIGSFPIGSFDLGSAPLSLLELKDFGGCEAIYGATGCSTTTALSETSSLANVSAEYGSLAASPLGSFPIGSFGIADLPMGSFPLGSFDVNGAPLGSFPLGSFDLIFSPLGSFPLGSFPLGSFGTIIDDPEGLCLDCLTLADAARAGVISSTATLEDLQVLTEFETTTLGEVLDAMTLATLYCPPDPDPSTGPLVECAETLGQIKDPGNLTLGQLLIAMMLKTDFPWETIPLDQLDAQEFSADNIISYLVDFSLTGSETAPVSVAVTVADSFLYERGSASLVIETPLAAGSPTSIADPMIIDNGNGTQTLNYSLTLGGFGSTNNTIRFNAVPALALGGYPATATVQLGTGVPVEANNSLATVTIIPDPETDSSEPVDAPVAPADVLLLGYIDAQDDNDYFLVEPPAAGDRVAVFMSNPVGDNDLIMYEPITTVEAKGQTAESPALDSIPFEDDGVSYDRNLAEEPNALEDVNLATAPLASISTNRGSIDESVSAIAGDTEPFMIQVSGYNGATSPHPYTMRVKFTSQVPSPQCTARTWPVSAVSTVIPAGSWELDTNAVFLVNWERLAASDTGGVLAADNALIAINSLVDAPGITNGVVVDVSTIPGVDAAYAAWDANPCDVDAPNDVVNAITEYLELQRAIYSDLAYVTIVGSDEVIPFARKPDETSIANESTFAGEFSDNAMYGALITRHFLSDDTYGDIDPIPWLDRYLNVPELGVGRLVESAADIQIAAENYIDSAGRLNPQTALSAGYDFIADSSEEIDNTFIDYGPVLGFDVVYDEKEFIDLPDVLPGLAWTREDFLGATGLVPTAPGDPLSPVDLVSFNMHFDFDEALPSSGDAGGDYTNNLINVADLAGADLTGGIWFTVGCHSGSSVADVSVVGAAPSEDWAQTFSRLGALYLAQNAYGLGDTEAVALTERLMANFARNLNGSMSIGQAHAFAKQQYFADLGLYGEYDYKALQAATLFGLPMYQYGNGAMVVDPPPLALPVVADPLSGLTSASWSLSDTQIPAPTITSKGALFSVDGDGDGDGDGEVQFVHFRPLQPIVRRDVTGPNGETASGAFLTSLVTEDIHVPDIAFARPVIDLGENETEIESDEVVFPTAFTNIASYKAPSPDGGPFESRSQLNVIVGQFTSPPDGGSSGTERLFRSFDAQVFYRSAASAAPAMATATVAIEDDFIRPEFDNVQASVVGSGGAQQAAFSVDVFDESTVERVAVLYLQSVSGGRGNWVLVDLVEGGGNNWTGGGPVDLTGVADGQIDYMVQAVDSNGNVANSTFKGLFYVAEQLPTPPVPDSGDPPGDIAVVVTVDGDEVDPGDWISNDPVKVGVVNQDPEKIYVFSVDGAPFELLTSDGFQITEDGVHIVTVQESDGSNPVTFVVLIDTTSPEALITTPANGEFFEQGQAPAAEFDCLDAGSGISTCVGTVPDGAPVPSVNPGSQSFTLTAQDYAHQNDDPSSPVVAEHVYYVVKPLEVGGPMDPTAITDPVTVTASATDLLEFAETVTIDWGDGSLPETVDLSGGSVSSVSSDHIYPAADVYQVTITVDYAGQHSQVGVVDFVVIYDSSAGFVTGGGWINSPTGAYTPDTNLTGKANFGFVSKYKKGQSVPSGSTTFRFAAGDLKFEATAYDWMIISGSRARYKGVGTIKGETGLYKFQVTALDADISGAGITDDGFRIKIWQEDSSGAEIVLYDNGLGVDDSTDSGGTTSLGGGSIKIHQVKKK